MPTTIIRAAATYTNENGETVNLTPQESLKIAGPCIGGVITVSDAQQKALEEKNEGFEQRRGMILIDTGASTSCFDDNVAQELKLPIVGKGKMSSASHSESEVAVYAGKLMLPSNLAINVHKAIGANLVAQGLIALIGRDILEHGTLFYNGIDGSATFSLL